MENNLLVSVVLIFLNLVLTVGVAVIAFFLKDYKSGIKERFDGQEKKIEKVAQDLSDFQLSMPHHYVLRDDWLRSMAGFDHKLDQQRTILAEIQKTLLRRKDAADHA